MQVAFQYKLRYYCCVAFIDRDNETHFIRYKITVSRIVYFEYNTRKLLQNFWM